MHATDRQGTGVSDLPNRDESRLGHRCAMCNLGRRVGYDVPIDRALQAPSCDCGDTRSIDGSFGEHQGILIEVAEISGESTSAMFYCSSTNSCQVLDEADRLLDMDFGPIIDKILKVIPKERNTYLFSATMTTKVAKLQRASLNKPVRVEVSSK